MSARDALRCPVTGQPLDDADGALVTADGSRAYPVRDGVISLLASSGTEQKRSVQAFYEQVGWQKDDDDVFADTARFVDRRPVMERYLSGCRRRIGRPLPSGGGVLLDVASGPVQFPEYVAYQDGFDERVCMDFSLLALRQARANVGDKGLFVQGDITNLPLADDSVDAAVSLHTIYHVPRDEQPTAFRELHRVLAPGGVAVVAYSWGHTDWSELSWPRRAIHLPTRVVRRLRRGRAVTGHRAAQAAGDEPELYFHAFDHHWFTRQPWPFEYEILTHRLFTTEFLGRVIGDGRGGRALLAAINAVEDRFPRLCGRVGRYPLIVIRG